MSSSSEKVIHNSSWFITQKVNDIGDQQNLLEYIVGHGGNFIQLQIELVVYLSSNELSLLMSHKTILRKTIIIVIGNCNKQIGTGHSKLKIKDYLRPVCYFNG
jgi:hypothetical protein